MKFTHYTVGTTLIFLFFLYTLPQALSGSAPSSDGQNYNSLIEIGNKNLKIQQWDAAVDAFKKALKIQKTAEAHGGMARGKFGKVKIAHERVLPMRALSNRRAVKDAE